MTLDEIYQTVQSNPHGSSGRGVSYWQEALKCGRRVNLNALYPRPPAEADEDGDINPLRCGTFFHALQEASLKTPEGQVWDMTDSAIKDPDWMEALRLYRAYSRHWGTPAKKWAAGIVSVEEKLPASETIKTLVRELFDEDVTFRADWVGNVIDTDSVQSTTGLMLPEPGLYLFDHKTAGARKAIHEWEFQFGIQGITYLHLYNLEHPEAPAKGMIFDQILRHSDISKEPLLTKTGTIRRESSYRHFLTLPNENAEKIIRNMVRKGKLNIVNNEADSSECFSGYKPCWFFQAGLCERY